MTVAPTAPVTDIQGIGQKTADALKGHDVRFALDLVRVKPDALHGVLSKLASRDECAAWIQAAHLLQVDEVTPQFAEALVGGDVTTVEMLAGADISNLEALFAQAVQASTIPAAPGAAQLTEMVRDATAIHYTGSVTGTVLDGDGKPIDGAKVEIGLQTGHTNPAGRYRVLRVPVQAAGMLVISHDDFETLAIDDPALAHDDEVLVTATHTLIRKPASSGDDDTASSAAAATAAELDELLGDLLPPASAGLELKVERQPGQDPRVGDILMVHKLYKRKPDALLQSRFRALKGGKIIIRTYRVPLSALPSGIKAKDHVQRLTSGLEAIDLTPERLARRKALRRVRSRHSYSPETRQERMQHILQVFAELSDEPEFGPIRARRTSPAGGA